ncbi:hypothetical protein F4777DRAFT_582758 [Nemania sp. FL0916]|nr:hypothetical protein F4777DRAFT_582758 [Nemania sp. FL0916]
MAVLRKMSHREPRPKSVEIRPSERQTKEERPPAMTRKSPRRTRGTNNKATKPDRAPTPLAEKKNENARTINTRLPIRSKLRAEPSPTRVSSPDSNRSSSRRRNKGGVTKAKATKNRRPSRDSDRNWGENVSPRAKKSLLEDEMPLIIHCWQ